MPRAGGRGEKLVAEGRQQKDIMFLHRKRQRQRFTYEFVSECADFWGPEGRRQFEVHIGFTYEFV